MYSRLVPLYLYIHYRSELLQLNHEMIDTDVVFVTALKLLFSIRPFLPSDTARVMFTVPITFTTYFAYLRLVIDAFTELL